jgi:hypothetical protein
VLGVGVQQAHVLAMRVGVADDDREGQPFEQRPQLPSRIGRVGVQQLRNADQGRAAVAFVIGPAVLIRGVDAQRLAGVLLVDALDGVLADAGPVVALDDDAVGVTDLQQAAGRCGKPSAAGQCQAVVFEQHDAAVEPVVDLQDVRGGVTRVASRTVSTGQ